jgi:membrane fusion protein (multidrug efflux system)
MYRPSYDIQSRSAWYCTTGRWFRALATVMVLVIVGAAVAADGTGEDKPGQEESPAATPGGPHGPPPALVRVAPVLKQLVQDQWAVVGRLVEVRHAVVAAEQSGLIIEVATEQGDAVVGRKTALARIDDVWAKLAQRTAEADLAQAQARVLEETAQLDRARHDARFLDELLASKSAKPKEVSDAHATVAEKTATLAIAKAAVTGAEVRLARCAEDLSRLTAVAPFDGVVVRKMTEVGQWVTVGSPVAEIISIGQIDARIDVPERFVNFLSRGMQVEINIDALATTVTAKVASITPRGSTAARTFPVKVRFDDRKGKFKPGMSVTAHIPTGKRQQRLTVPRDAVKRTAQGAVVWTNLGGKAMSVGVKVLFGTKDRYVIVPVGVGPPLPSGSKVVIEGAERLFPTQPLIIITPPTDAAPSKP